MSEIIWTGRKKTTNFYCFRSTIEDGVHEEEQLNFDEEMADEDRELLTIYQHCWDDDKVDVDLVASLLHKIVVTQPEGLCY